MKNFKKVIACILAFAMLLPVAVIPAFGEEEPTVKVTSADNLDSAFAEGENSLIVFVTGIGQSWSYLFDESYLADDAFENGTLQDYENYAELIAEGKYIARWNLFNNYFDEALKDKDTLRSAIKIVVSLLFGMITRRNTIKDEDVRTLVTSLLSYNIIDENGKTDARVVTPRYTMPVADYPTAIDENGNEYSEAKARFFRSIPCKERAMEKFGDDYEQYLYCYNYSAFSYTSDNVSGLHDFVETIIAENKVGAKDVVLVPMSMGASVVSAYLAAYPQVADNHVRRVVSIVGCWNGSDVVYDLLTQNYVDNSADLFYNGIIADLVGEPWGYLVNFALRLFSKNALRSFIDQALSIVCEEILLKTPSLLALVPSYDYAEIREMITDPAIRQETDTYYAAQSTIQSRLAALEEQGMTFSFVAGYGLPYGAITSDYEMFGFMAHSATTNSDEIINIDSTAPGTSYVPAGAVFTDTEGRELSPDGSIDISTTYYKDSTWFFYGQKHELEYNNTALRLAIDLALGEIKTVEDCDNLEEDGIYYPQFNGARNVRSMTENYIPDLEAYLAAGGTLNADQQALYEKGVAMVNSCVNDEAADNALQDEFRAMLVELGIYQDSATESNKAEEAFGNLLRTNNRIINKLFGSKGFLDTDFAC